MKSEIFYIPLLIMLMGCATASPQEKEMLSTAKVSQAPIFWEDLNVGPPNSANGKEISWAWHNISGKTIKYARFRFDFFNKVNDYASCSYGAGTSVRQTGPIEPGERESRKFTSLCYDSDIVCGEISQATLEFMDGEVKTYSKDDLLALDAIDESDKCGDEY